jgi:uncharacterized protein (DUF2336 family)
LLASARERLSVALADLALPAELRLTEWQRTIVANLLEALVGSIEEELRADLAGHFNAAGDEAAHAALTSHVAIAAPILERSEAPWNAPLIGALLRRAEEHRLHKAAGADNALLIELAGEGSDAIAGEAMALLVAQGARLDRFQEPVMARTELDAELQHVLVWSVAAALRHYLTERQQISAGKADAAIAGSAGRLLAAYDEGRRVEAMALRLVRMLAKAGRLDDRFIVRALTEGSLPLFLAALAARTGLDFEAVWEILSAPAGRGPALLLRAAGVGRGEAGAILLVLDEEGAEGQLDLFDAGGEAEAAAALGLWQVDPGYRRAIARLAQ